MDLLRKLTQAWRNAATAISFATFGLFGLVLSLLVFPPSRLLVRNPQKRHAFAQRCIQASFILFIKWMRLLRALDYRIENPGRLRDDDGCLILANHPSLLDYVFIASLMPRCDCIVKKSLWNNFFIKNVIRAAGYIPNTNDDPEQLLAACREKLSQGGRLLIFPEGTRTTPGQPLQLQRGAANIAVRSRADIRLIHITCAPPILTRQQKWWQTAPTRPLFTIRVGEKLPISNFTRDNTPPSLSARLLTEHLAHALRPASSTHEPPH